jgi:hypothetical protein
VKAIDFMYYVSTPEFIAKWTQAKKGELICRMERAIGGLPQYDSIEAHGQDEVGVIPHGGPNTPVLKNWVMTGGED